MRDVKVFAMYLPQFHKTEENSRFWGEGFTDWVSVRQARPLFEGHDQPKVPLDDNYYDLSTVEAIRWQAELASEYKVSGWGIYHYWFNSRQQTLTRPAEILLENKDIEIPFFLAWDNASWKRTWSKLKGNDWAPMSDTVSANPNGPEILIAYQLGSREDWIKHFEYLLPYFKDDRYEKNDNRPVFLIYNYSSELEDMVACWDELARENGFAGVEIIYSYNPFHGIPGHVKKFRYEPLFSGWGSLGDRIKRFLFRKKVQTNIKRFSYEKVWKNIITSARKCKDPNMYYGAFVGYDDSPRRGNKGKAVIGATPQLFGEKLSELISVCRRQNKKYIFLTAWNEWGEGAHLEPDEKDKYAYLNAYREAVSMKDE